MATTQRGAMQPALATVQGYNANVNSSMLHQVASLPQYCSDSLYYPADPSHNDVLHRLQRLNVNADRLQSLEKQQASPSLPTAGVSGFEPQSSLSPVTEQGPENSLQSLILLADLLDNLKSATLQQIAQNYMAPVDGAAPIHPAVNAAPVSQPFPQAHVSPLPVAPVQPVKVASPYADSKAHQNYYQSLYQQVAPVMPADRRVAPGFEFRPEINPAFGRRHSRGNNRPSVRPQLVPSPDVRTNSMPPTATGVFTGRSASMKHQSPLMARAPSWTPPVPKPLSTVEGGTGVFLPGRSRSASSTSSAESNLTMDSMVSSKSCLTETESENDAEAGQAGASALPAEWSY